MVGTFHSIRERVERTKGEVRWLRPDLGFDGGSLGGWKPVSGATDE